MEIIITKALFIRARFDYRDEFCCVLICEILARSIRTNSENTIKVVENVLISFATAIALFNLVTLLIKLIRVSQK